VLPHFVLQPCCRSGRREIGRRGYSRSNL
jgi:hypothetical protein